MADEVVQHYLYNISGGETSSIKDGDTTNPILYEPGDSTGTKEATVTAGDYVDWVEDYQHDDPVVPEFNNNPLYVYTLNSEWKYVGGLYNRVGCNFVHNCAGDSELTLANGDNFEGSTCDEVIIKPKDGNTIYRSHIKNTNFYEYDVNPREEDEYYEASEVFTTTSATIKVTPGDGISALIPSNIGSDLDYGIYQYPGIWVRGNNYPDLTINPEPKFKGHVQLKWTDPPDITDWKPTPATWEGTVIVRKENSAPLHRWDGNKVVRTTTRDKYKSKPYKDEDIETNKVYYYAFMPYYTKIDDPQHPIRYYTFTKCIRVETGTISYIPEIIKIDMADDVATITYSIVLPATGPYDTAKLYGKKDGNPACDNTDDIVEDISQVDDQIVVPDIDGDYYFCIQVANGTDTLTSDVVSCSGEAYSGNNAFSVKYETRLAFDGSSWYNNANPNYNRYNFDGSSTWRDVSYSLDLKARYFGISVNNIRFDIKNIQITYTISGESKTKYLDELLLDSTLSNVIHYNTEITNDWPCTLEDQTRTFQLIGNVQVDNQHLIHLGRPNYSVMGLTYDSTNKMYSVTNNTDIHADCYVLPLKKKYHITGISYTCRRQANDPGWGAWKGASISFSNGTTV